MGENLDHRHREARVGKCACGDGNHAGPHFDIVKDRRSAIRAEMIGVGTAAVGLAREAPVSALGGYIVRHVAGVPCKGASRAPLATQAVADGNPIGLAGAKGAKLSAIALRQLCIHSDNPLYGRISHPQIPSGALNPAGKNPAKRAEKRLDAVHDRNLSGRLGKEKIAHRHAVATRDDKSGIPGQ